MSSEAFDRASTISLAELELLRSYTHVGQSLYLRGPRLKLAKRIIPLGLLEQGRLGERYFTITQAGFDLVENVGRHRAS